MVAAVIGATLVAVDIGGRIWLSRALKREGRPPRLAWTRVYISPFLWLGLVMLSGAIGGPVGAAIFAVTLCCALVFAVWLIVGGVRGAWRLPEAVRLIGDPKAWEGARRASWDRSGREEPAQHLG
jgi:hypothetical protein